MTPPDPLRNDYRRNWLVTANWLRRVSIRLRKAKTRKEAKAIAALLSKRAERMYPKERKSR